MKVSKEVKILVCIYDFNGKAIDGTYRHSRKKARQDFALANGTKWGYLWELGYRCRKAPNRKRPSYER